jgi:hypothetical protein
LFVHLPPGWLGDWHPAPRRQYWLGVIGTVEVTVSAGEVRQFGPGHVALLEDLAGKGHVTRAVAITVCRQCSFSCDATAPWAAAVGPRRRQPICSRRIDA